MFYHCYNPKFAIFIHVSSVGNSVCLYSACVSGLLSLSNSLQEAIVTGLLPETTYTLTVAAYTIKGDGARSKTKMATTTGAGKLS